MQIIRFGPEQARPVVRYGSDFHMARVHTVGGEIFVGAMYIPAGGLVGYHPATCPQLFMVVQGSGWVRAGLGERVEVSAGSAALWEKGEKHEAGSETGMNVIVLEYEIPAEIHRFPAEGQTWTVSLARGDERERQALDQLARLLQDYDLAKWAFTRRVHIERGTIPHSHPVLTLNTRHLDRDDLALSTFLHEQVHWFEVERRGQADAAIAELKQRYPEVPVDHPEGAGSEESTYLHLIICPLEVRAVREVLGATAARRVLDYWAGDHYKWVYQTVQRDGPALEALLERHGLLL
ncbi:MAG: hypothetical protein ACOY94_09575 [Bacillota bacterium]